VTDADTLAQLRQRIDEHFSEEELRTLCFDLGVDYDNLPGRAKVDKARELVAHFDRCERIPELTAALARQRPTLDWLATTETAEAEPPFKGLLFFDEADASLFFGRESLTTKLTGRLHEEHFLSIVGASGSGKSSVLRAGLVHQLRSEGTWVIAVLIPGSSQGSFYALASALLPLLDPKLSETDILVETRKLSNALRQGEVSLLEVTERILKKAPAAGRLLLAIDQFEEVFTTCKDQGERQAFVDTLLEAITPDEAAMTVVIALRADFYHHCAQFDNLRKALARHQEYIGPMNVEELRRAIQEPARRSGWEFEPGLVDLLLRDVGDEPGALPLLSHALLETWKRRQGRTLVLSGYAESGGVQGAIAQSAEAVFNQLTPEQQLIARNVFLRLTELGEGTPDTRRRVSLIDLVPSADDKRAVEVTFNTLANARLVTIAAQSVEVSHEALIREWPRLQQWLSEDREKLRIHRQLAHNAQEWVVLNRDSGGLYRGARLAVASEWIRDHADETNALEKEFLTASMVAAEAERRTARQRLQLVIVGLTTVLVIISALAIIAFQQRNASLDLQKRILAQDWATSANSLAGKDNDLSLLLAMEAARTDRNFQTEDALRRALGLPVARTVLKHPGLRAMVFSPDGARIVTAGDDTLGRVWSWPDGKELLTLRGHKGWIVSVDYSSDGTRIVTASIDGTARLWDAKTGEEIAVLRDPNLDCMPGDMACRIWQASFDPSGQLVATGNDSGHVYIWNATTGELDQTLPANNSSILYIRFSSDSKHIAVVSRDYSARVWGIEQKRTILHFDPTESVRLVAFSPDGSHVLTCDVTGVTKTWNLTSGDLERVIADSGKSNGSGTLGPQDAHFSKDGKKVVIAGNDNRVEIWNLADSGMVTVLVGHEDTVMSAQFSSEGDRVLTAGKDGTARLWDALTGDTLSVYTGVSSRYGEARGDYVHFSPDGRYVLAVGQDDGKLLEWPTSPELGDTVALLPGSLYAGDLESLSRQFSADGATFLTAGANIVYEWKMESWTPIVTLRGGASIREYLDAPSLSPDGTMIFTTYGWEGALTDINQARIWDAATGKLLASFGDFITGGRFSPDGTTILTNGWNANYRLWDTVSFTEVPLPANAQVQFGPCRRMITVSQKGTTDYYSWNAPTLERIPVSTVTAGCGREDRKLTITNVSRDGKRRVIVDSEGTRLGHTATVQDTATGNTIGILRSHKAELHMVFFSPDGKYIIASGADNVTRIWFANVTDLLDLAKSRVTRDLTCQEQLMYLHEPVKCTP